MRAIFGFILAAAVGLASGQTYDLKMAFMQWDSTALPDAALERHKNNGYKYLVVGTSLGHLDFLSDWDQQGNIKPGSKNLENRLKQWFLQVDAKGMRLIPMFTLGSIYSAHWEMTNTNIKMNSCPDPRYMTPPFAPDAAGIDKSVSSLLGVISRAYSAAKPQMAPGAPAYPEYVHLGHDEAHCGYKANAKADLMVGLHPSSPDRAFISNLTNQGKTFQYAVQALLANEVHRRVSQVQTIINPSTKLLLWADMWDPQAAGNMDMKAYNGTEIKTESMSGGNPGVGTLPGLTTTQATLVKNGMIWMLWNYGVNWADDGHPILYWNYNTSSAFTHFKNKGFKFVWCHAITDLDRRITSGRQAQLAEFIAVGKNSTFNGSLVGFAATQFGFWKPSLPSNHHLQPKTFFSAENVAYFTMGKGLRFGVYNATYNGYGNVTAWPVPMDYTGDGEADLSVWVSNGEWHIDSAGNGFGAWDQNLIGYGDASTVPVPADYSGDGRADLALYTRDGRWLIDNSEDGFGQWNDTKYGYGDNRYAVPVPADYDGDGKADIAIKTDAGVWMIDSSRNGFGIWDVQKPGYGNRTALPAPGDYDYDGRADIAVKSPDGQFHIDHAKGGFGAWERHIPGYGDGNAWPYPADYDGDGKVDISVHVSNGQWKIDYAANGYGTWDLQLTGYGNHSTMDVVPADYDGDGRADLSIKDDAGKWMLDLSAQ